MQNIKNEYQKTQITMKFKQRRFNRKKKRGEKNKNTTQTKTKQKQKQKQKNNDNKKVDKFGFVASLT